MSSESISCVAKYSSAGLRLANVAELLAIKRAMPLSEDDDVLRLGLEEEGD